MKSTFQQHTGLMLFRLCFVTLSSLTLVACPKKEEAPAGPDLKKFSGIYESYLKACGECHAPDQITYKDEVPGLDLSSKEAAYTSLLGERELKRLNGFGCSATVKYVMAGEPSESVLYAILDSQTRESFNAGVDDSCRPKLHTRADGGEANDPTPEQKAAIKDWITNGAAQD